MSSCAAGFENAAEQRTPIDLRIHGEIPPWLSGVLYRTGEISVTRWLVFYATNFFSFSSIGPGVTRIPTASDPSKTVDIQHWFDGLALHHRFEIFPGGQRVAYRSRKGSEDLEREISETGSYPGFSFGQQADPCESIFRKFFTVFKTLRGGGTAMTPAGINASVTMTPDMPGWEHHTSLPAPSSSSSGPRYLVVKTDADILQLLDPITLEPLAASRYQDLSPALDGQLSAAHSCRDHTTGDFFNYSCKLGGRFPTYKIFRIGGKDEKVDVLAEIKDAPASYIHSFAMTDRFVILSVWQAHITQYVLLLLL